MLLIEFATEQHQNQMVEHNNNSIWELNKPDDIAQQDWDCLPDDIKAELAPQQVPMTVSEIYELYRAEDGVGKQAILDQLTYVQLAEIKTKILAEPIVACTFYGPPSGLVPLP